MTRRLQGTPAGRPAEKWVAVYRRSGDGSAIGLVKAYFDVVPSSERKIFATQVSVDVTPCTASHVCANLQALPTC